MLKIEIYINERPVESFSQEELTEIKKTLTETAMRAAGYKRNDVLHETRRTGTNRN